jgi:hypothetical protein
MPYETKLYQTRSERMWPIEKARMPPIPRFPANITQPIPDGNPPDELVWTREGLTRFIK